MMPVDKHNFNDIIKDDKIYINKNNDDKTPIIKKFLTTPEIFLCLWYNNNMIKGRKLFKCSKQ